MSANIAPAATSLQQTKANKNFHPKHPGSVLFKQLNLAKSKAAQASLAQHLVSWSCRPLFVFLQEPAISRGKVESIPRGLTCFATKNPRAAILATTDLQVWALPTLTSPDVAACRWKTGNLNFPEIVVISVYSDINKPTISSELSKITTYCGTHHLPCIIGADTNAHSVIWGSPENNTRGDDYEAFIAGFDLSVLNTGSLPTFSTSRAQSIIDVSLVHVSLFDLAFNWYVSRDDYLSDHKCLSFEMKLPQQSLSAVKNWRRTDWSLFASRMQRSGSNWDAPSQWDPVILDQEVSKLSMEITSCVDKCTPSFIPRLRVRKNRWWTEEVAHSRKIVRTSYRTWILTGSETDRQLYVSARQEFKHSTRVAKLTSWQQFCSSAGSFDEGSPKELARINKILYRNVNRTLGMLHHSNGDTAASPEESMDILLDEHFPGSIPLNSTHLGTPVPPASLNAVTLYPWITVERIRRAIAQFSPYKAAGIDEIKPIALQNLPASILERLRTLFTTSIDISYVPKIWRTSKAIFIPKLGKDDYAHPRSWRPISLMSFLFKTLERLLLWHLEETVLKDSFHKNQHAFRKGRSTESALSDTVDVIESTVLRQGTAIGVFLDIEGAFDNLLPEGVIKSLRSRNTPPHILLWLQNYLLAREVTIDFKGVQTSRQLVRGTPQGGVLSPVLWNLAFDEILSIVEGSPVKACGYADDLALIGRGPDPISTINVMQQILYKVASWGQDQGLRFSAAKSVAIAFTRKQNWAGPQLSLNNIALPWQTNVKYLGVLLHHRLSWSDHIKATTKKAKWLLFKYKNIVGSQFGPQPRYMRWMYTGIVRPALIYGSLVWWRSALDRGRLATFTTISRLALLTFATVRSSTPTIGLEAMGYLPPMDLFLEGEVTKAWLRVKTVRAEIWDGIGSHSFRGHRLALQKLTNTFHLQTFESDEMAEYKKWTRTFQVDQDFSNDTPRWSSITCFTTGAKTKGRAGSGFVICQPGPITLTDAFPMGTAPSKFQAEMTAILRVAEALRPLVHLGPIVIHSDSQATVSALNRPTITSKTTLATIFALEALALSSNSSVKVAWVAKKFNSVNLRKATELANRGALLPPTEPEPVVPPPKTHIISVINTEVERRWNQRWTSQPRPARQIRLLWPTIDQQKSLQLLRCDRQEYGDLVRLLTGHNYLNRHCHLLDEAEEDICRLCYEAEESSEHLLCYCPALDGTRLRVLGQAQFTAASLSQVPLDGQRRLISLIRQSLLDGGAEQI